MSLFGSMIEGVWNYNVNAYNNKINKEIADQNLAFQRENLEYQKDLQQQIFDREDTAYQRKVQDLVKAGINPAVAAGGSGSAAGSIVSTQAPHNDMKYQAPQFNLGSAIDTLKSLKQIASIEEQTSVAKAQADYISSMKKKADAETVKLGLENGFFTASQADRLKRIGFETDMLSYQKDMLSRQNDLNKIGYNFALGNSVINNFKTSNAPLLQELQINQDLLKLKKEFSKQNVKKIKMDNGFAPWLFGADMLQRLLNMGNSAMQMVGKGAMFGLW